MRTWGKPQYHAKGGAKGAAAGYSSGLEGKVASALQAAGVDAEYEARTLYYTVPARVARYTPDFILPNGVVLEVKGEWTTEDRQKHRLLREQYPDLDVRILFGNANATIGKKSSTTYAMHCERLGIKCASKIVPPEWWSSNKREDARRWKALEAACIKPQS